MPSSTPMEGSRGVEGVVVVKISPVATTTATTSVKVPPVAMPILSRRWPRAGSGSRSVIQELRGEGVERGVEAGAGRLHETGADLADPRIAMRDPGIDLGQDAGLHHEACVDPGGGAAKPERRDPVRRALSERDLVHQLRVAERVAPRTPHELDDGGRPRHGDASDPRRLGDPAVAD